MAITAIGRYFQINPNIVGIITSDDLTAITTTDYLLDEADNIEALNAGEFEWLDTDIVLISYSGGIGYFTRDSANNTFDALPASPGTLSNTLQDGEIFVGNALNVATGVALSGDATIDNAGVLTIAADAIDSDKVDPTLIQYAEVDFTAAQWNGMYAAPRQLVPAGGANTVIVVDKVVLNMTFVSAQFANGGVVAAQYDSTANGLGAPASATVAAATINGYAASTGIMLAGAMASVAFTDMVNKGIYLSNQTAAFATGDSTFKVQIWYHTVATV